MLLAPNSRYAGIDTATLTDADGRQVVYLRRRFLPRGSRMPVLAEVAARPGDRLDLVAARTLGSPELFWRICDANDVMSPDELTAVLGATIRIPAPSLTPDGS